MVLERPPNGFITICIMESLTALHFLCSNDTFLEVGLHEGLQLGVTLCRIRGYTFRVFKGYNRGGQNTDFLR